MDPVVLGVITTVVVVGVMLTGSFVYWSLRAQREAQAQALSRRLGTLAREPEAGDLFHSREPDPVAQALGFVGKHLEELVRQAGARSRRRRRCEPVRRRRACCTGVSCGPERTTLARGASTGTRQSSGERCWG